jgi:hypothetical protein
MSRKTRDLKSASHMDVDPTSPNPNLNLAHRLRESCFSPTWIQDPSLTLSKRWRMLWKIEQHSH